MDLREKIKKHKKVILVLGVIFVLIVIIASSVTLMQSEYSKKLKDLQETNQKYVGLNKDLSMINTSSEIKQTKKLNDLEIKNIKIVKENEITNITAEVLNTGDETVKPFNGILKFTDDSGNQIEEIEVHIERIKPGETSSLSAMTTADLINAYNVEISEK